MSIPSDPRLRKLDTARWLAALAVVLLHCAAAPVSDAGGYGSSAWLAANIYDSAVRWCVPVFVMISGALLLAPERVEPLRRYYAKRAARICLPLVFWTAFYLAWSALQLRLDHDSAEPRQWLIKLADGTPYYHLWYLYMIVGLYLFAPFVREIYLRCGARRRLAWVAGIFCVAALDTLYRQAMNAGHGFFLTWFLPYLGYFVAGRMIFEGALRVPLPRTLLAASVGATALGVYGLSTAGALNLYFYEYFSLTVPVMSLAIFQLILNSRLPRMAVLAPLTFGVYLIHPVFIDIARRTGLFAGRVSDGWNVPLAAATVFALSAISTWLMQRSSFMRRVT